MLPGFLRARYGDDINKGIKNYMCYTTFIPRILRPCLRLFLSTIIKKASKKNFYTIGLANHGIFGNEPEYENINEFKKDIEMLKKSGAKNICVYSIEGLLKRKNAAEWLNMIRSCNH